jgi:hypothetical protein
MNMPTKIETLYFQIGFLLMAAAAAAGGLLKLCALLVLCAFGVILVSYGADVLAIRRAAEEAITKRVMRRMAKVVAAGEIRLAPASGVYTAPVAIRTTQTAEPVIRPISDGTNALSVP